MTANVSDMQNVNGMLSNRGQLDKANTSEDLDNDFMNELNQFEFEINNERQRRHSQQRIQYNGEQSLNGAAAARSNGAATGKKVMRKKRHTKQRTDDDNGRKSHYRSSAKPAKMKQDQEQMDEYSSSPYSSEDERYSSGPESPGYDDEYSTAGTDKPFQSKQQKSQQQQQFDANSKNGHFVEATNLLSESEQYTQQTQQQYYAINEQFDDGISKDGGRIVSDIDDNLDAPNQSKFDSEMGYVHTMDSTDIGSPSTDQTTFHKEQSLTSEISTDVIDDASMTKEPTPTKSGESGSSETSTFKSRMNKVLSHESSQDSQNGGLGSSKWKLLKTLKEKRIEEKNNQEKIKEEENANKDKTSVSSWRFQ